MIPSAPEALLLDHPALPVPLVSERGVELRDCRRPKSPRLPHRQRIRIATHLIAVTSLLAEFDLWPGTRALLDSRICDSGQGLQAVLSGVPRTLSRIWQRLGGGEAAADATREAVLDAVAATSGVPRGIFRDAQPLPGMFLGRELDRLLRELPKPLDPVTARNLWMARWPMPNLPDPGEAVFWSLLDGVMARRFAGAVWTLCRRKGIGAWLWQVGDRDRDTGPLPAVDAAGVLIVCGRPGRNELAAVARWIDRPGCRAVAVGSFPAGWRPPPPPGFDAGRLPNHLAVTGGPLELRRQQIEGRSKRFDPLCSIDRSTITEQARWLWRSPPARERGARRSPLERTLALLPEGLPEGFVLVHSGSRPESLSQQARDLSVVVDGDRWRLPAAEGLRRDPLHAEVALLFGLDDPKRLRHLALADGDARGLLKWARDRLNDLDGAAVREVLGGIEPTQLCSDVDLAYVEACLSELDLEGARTRLKSVEPDLRGPWQGWLEVIDAPLGHEVTTVSAEDVSKAARPTAEVALYLLRRAAKTGLGDLEEAQDLLDRSCRLLGGAVRRRFELERAALCRPRLLGNRQWRAAVVDGCRPLLRRLMHLRGLQLASEGRHRTAHRLLRMAAEDERSPGRLGFLQLDMGYWALNAGRSESAGLHLLRAVRLLEAAGFSNRTRLVLFNLAVSDLDQLRIRRARQRLRELRGQSQTVDPFVVGEEVRLALAAGEEAGFRHGLAQFPFERVAGDPRFSENIALLRGVEALITGDLDQARELLAGADEEGRPWLGLAAALSGERFPPAEPDGWGVSRASGLVGMVKQGRQQEARGSLPTDGCPDVRDAFSLGLVERLLGHQPWIDRQLRRGAIDVLERAGLSGWARVLNGSRDQRDRLVDGMSRLVDGGGIEGLPDDAAQKLFEAFHLSGLEVRSRAGDQLLCRWGQGVAGQATSRSRVVLVPLGGEPSDDPAWRLLVGLVDLLAPLPLLEVHDDGVETKIHGSSPAIRSLRRQLRLFAPTRLGVLVQGETGVGKEVAARVLHRLSGRSGRFVPVNVAAIPTELLEAELFGSIRGAYTGADRSRGGLVDAADGGTLFLDEIGDLEPSLQVKLLRFLESQEVRPVGSDAFHTVNVRIVSATHHHLERRIADGRFRHDLYYRIAAAPITVPPLRERREDIPLLKEVFEAEAARERGLRPCRWSPEAERTLAAYEWPGNVRELRHVIEVAMVRAAGAVVLASHLPIEVPERAPTAGWDEAMADFRRRFLAAALRRNAGNRSATARELGISRQTLLYHIRNLGLANLG